MHYRKNLLIWLIAILSFSGMYSCGKEEQVREIIRPVRYSEVFSIGGNRMRTFTGVAKAGVESNISFRVAGTVQKLKVKVGDKVRAGQLLAELDPMDYQLQVEQAKAALAQAKAQSRNAEAAYQRAMQLYENRNISKSDLDAARAAAESANAAVRSMEKQLELANRQYSYTKLIAPTQGAIAAVNCEINENVKIAQSIVSLTSNSQIEVELSVPEILITQITEGHKVTVSFDAIQGKEFEAIITEVGVSITGQAASYPVTVKLQGSTQEIRPGMAAMVSINFESSEKQERYIVASSAVMEDRQGRYVYIVEPSDSENGLGIIHRKKVEVGQITGEGLEILKGLKDGDRVVTAGVSRISDGQKVKI
jgi:RND family efflux transporter MFP subunit